MRFEDAFDLRAKRDASIGARLRGVHTLYHIRSSRIHGLSVLHSLIACNLDQTVRLRMK